MCSKTVTESARHFAILFLCAFSLSRMENVVDEKKDKTAADQRGYIPTLIQPLQQKRPVIPPLNATPSVSHATASGIRYCQGTAHQCKKSLPDNTILSANPLQSLRVYSFPSTQILGCSHPADIKECLLCVPSLNDTNPFLATCKALDAERDAIRNYIVDNRSILADALTWLACRRDWAITCEVHHYFHFNYQVLSEAMEEINKLPISELDGRGMAVWRESNLDMGQMNRPSYCSWLYFPSTKGEHIRVFYLATKLPLDSDIVDHLMVMLQPPRDLMEALTVALSKALDSPRAIGESRLKRRNSLYKKIPVQHPDLVSQGADDGSDPRTQRADRLEKIDRIKREFRTKAPRIILIATNPRITQLEPRPDYVLRRHAHYMNVFTLDITTKASTIWPHKLSDGYPSQQNAPW